MANRTPDHVYFAHVGDFLKVGVSSYPKERLRQIRDTFAPLLRPEGITPETPARLLGTMPGGPDLEADIHGDLWEWREVGEWFAATPEVLAYVRMALGEVTA